MTFTLNGIETECLSTSQKRSGQEGQENCESQSAPLIHSLAMAFQSYD